MCKFFSTVCIALCYIILLQSTKNHIGKLFTKDEWVLNGYCDIHDWRPLPTNAFNVHVSLVLLTTITRYPVSHSPRKVIERVGLLMTIASAWQFTDGIQVYNHNQHLTVNFIALLFPLWALNALIPIKILWNLPYHDLCLEPPDLSIGPFIFF